MVLLLGALLVTSLLTLARGLRCFAGDPVYQHECTSLSYCLLITSKTGKSQWSCDGNSYNQVSLCSTLALLDNDKTTTYDAFSSGGRAYDKSGYDGSSFLRVGSSHDSSQSGLAPRLSYTKDSGQREYSRNPSRAYYGHSRHVNKCFNGGELGKICCCSTDLCNSSYRRNCCYSLLVLLSIPLLISRRLYA